MRTFKQLLPTILLYASALSAKGQLLELPFFDDFTYGQFSPFPNPAKWTDSMVYINCDYPLLPPSIGVATFDGLRENGLPYGSIQEPDGPADTLTSRPINLNYSPADSIYLSFFYQAKGLGNHPETEDSLRLEFFSPTMGEWRYVWSVRGEIFPQVTKPFKQVLIPIRDTAFLKPGFRFRFLNFATGIASQDHWHIDYVRLDRFRNSADSLINDQAFIYRPTSWLEEYQSMPWSHFLDNPNGNMASTYSVALTNNSAAPSTRFYKYQAFNQLGSMRDELFQEPQGPIAPRAQFDVAKPVKYTFENVPFNYTFYNVWHTLATDDTYSGNDSALYFQNFSNFYALDDGTAEDRISLVNPGGGFVAQRFNIKKSDTLRSVQFSFNPELSAVSGNTFFACVWGASGNLPGALLWSQEIEVPLSFTPKNHWYTYPVYPPIFLNAGTYYVGWIQTSNYRLNVGFDRNIDNANKIFINLNGAWIPYPFIPGTLMVRTLFGGSQDAFVQHQPQIKQNTRSIRIFPNPASGFVEVRSAGSAIWRLELKDLQGRVCAYQNFEWALEQARWELPVNLKGLYFIAAHTENGIMYEKLLLAP